MFKVKLAVAAVMFVAVGAFASNFRVADQVYVPAAGHIVGGNQLFISDVFISNLTSDPVSVSVIFSAGAGGGAPQTFNNVISLGAFERQEIPDFVGTKLGLTANLGQLVFNGCKTGGNCDVTTCPNGQTTGECADFRNISVESRIYSVASNSASPTTAPSTGQLFSGIPWYNFVSSDAASVGLDKVFITGLRNNGQYRTNIGLVNASQFSTTTLTIKLFDGKTNNLLGTATQTLGPLGQAQPNIAGLFSSFTGATATNAFVTVEQGNTVPTADASANGCPNGCPAFFAYGSVLDNVSGDATTLEPQYLKSLWDIGANHGAVACIYNADCKAGLAVKIHRAVKH
jgi:hypothetical protein